MRGRLSSDRMVLSAAIGPQADAADCPRPSKAAPDREELPISAAELDALEAFLMPQIRAILDGDEDKTEDSKPPQKPGKVLTLSEVSP